MHDSIPLIAIYMHRFSRIFIIRSACIGHSLENIYRHMPTVHRSGRLINSERRCMKKSKRNNRGIGGGGESVQRERRTYNHAIINVIQYTFIMSLNENLISWRLRMNTSNGSFIHVAVAEIECAKRRFC